MASNRMAGDKLDENSQESQNAKQALSDSERNKQAREKIGNDPEQLAERMSRVDRNGFDLTGYTDKEINMALQGDSFGAQDYERLTGKSADGPPVNPPGGGIEPEVDGDPVVPEVAPITAGPIETNTGSGDVNIPTSPFAGGGGGSQTVVQDNDQTSTVVGNDNTVNQDQNNSVQNFGGRTFNPEDWKKSWMNNKFAA